MKAILKSNGKEVDVELYSPTRYIETKASDSYGKTIFDADALIVTGAPIDWLAFRREAAKDILAGMMAHQRIAYGSNEEILAKYALRYADELIKQLQGDEK